MYLGLYFSLKNDFYDVEIEDTNPENYTKGEQLVLKFSEQINEKIEIKEFVGTILYLSPHKKFTPPCPIVILRRVTVNDLQKIESNKDRSEKALEYFKEKIDEFKLDMHPIRAQYSFDGGSIYFSFTAPERIDFRDLVKDLAAHFKKKIFLQQIGPRDRAQITGGFGKCGRSLCCNTHLYSMPSVSMEAVRLQNLLYRNTAKLSGLCGKLLCCLNYELEEYAKLEKNIPPVGTTVKHKLGEGYVTSIDILNQLVKIVLPNGRYETVPVQEVTVVKMPTDNDKNKTVSSSAELKTLE